MNLRRAFPRRMASTAWLVVLGGALSVAIWISGEPEFAAIMAAFYVVAGVIAYVVAGGSSDIAAIMRTDTDERQRRIDHDAVRVAGWVMGGVALLGVIVQVARGEDPGGFAWVLMAGGAAYSIALGVLARRT